MTIRRDRQKVWFERWVMEGYSMRQLMAQSGYSRSTVQRLIGYWLARPPKLTLDLSAFKYLVVDGSYLLARKTAVVGVADTSCRCLVDGRYGLKEGERRMQEWCLRLRQAGLMPESITIDGLKQVQALLEAVWPRIVIQRCLVHIQRQGLAWCRRDPHTAAVKHLRRLFDEVTHITTIKERDRFISRWEEWEARFGVPIASRPARGRVFSDVKRARSLLHYALPNMFHYLENPQIPNNTNWLEGYFSRLKSRYRQHRGLSRENRLNYFSWYFHLCKK
jgi:transposase-like protein